VRRQGEAEVSVTAEVLTGAGGLPDRSGATGDSFLGPLVARLSAQYGLDPRAVRSLAVPVLASFAGARVRAFVPVLVEKRLRGLCRSLSGLPGTPAAHEESAAALG
jgi:hypothetical protein